MWRRGPIAGDGPDGTGTTGTGDCDMRTILAAAGVIMLLGGCGEEPDPAPPVEPTPAQLASTPEQSSTKTVAPGSGIDVCNDGIDRYLVLVNESGLSLNYFYASPKTTSEWEEDVLGEDTVASGGRFRINFNSDDRCTCNYDTRAVFADDSERRGEANVCSDHELVFR